MTDNCPPECQNELKHINDDLNGHGRTLYGDDGKSGIVEDYVSKKRVLLFVGLMTAFILAGINSWSSAKDERQNNKTSIAVVQKELEGINNNINEIKSKQIDPDILLEKIRRIIKP